MKQCAIRYARSVGESVKKDTSILNALFCFSQCGTDKILNSWYNYNANILT